MSGRRGACVEEHAKKEPIHAYGDYRLDAGYDASRRESTAIISKRGKPVVAWRKAEVRATIRGLRRWLYAHGGERIDPEERPL